EHECLPKPAYLGSAATGFHVPRRAEAFLILTKGMSMPISRRIILKSLGMASFLSARSGAAEDERLTIAGRPVEVSVTPIGPSIVRISLAPMEGGRAQPIPGDGSLVRLDWGAPILRLTSLAEPRVIACGDSRVTVSGSPLTFRIEAKDGR